MQQNWRSLLRERIKQEFVQGDEQAWFDDYLSTAGTLDLTIVSNQFAKASFSQRRERIQQLLAELAIPFAPGMFSLYTLQEAADLGMKPAIADEGQPLYSWYDLAMAAANSDTMQMPRRHEPGQPQTITFYSFKGGVGRTTALAHVAWILATRGRKVVVVDLDLEAPGLSSAFDLTTAPSHGIVDYLYERAYLPEGEEPDIPVADIFTEVVVPDASGRLFVVPAGKLDLDYITKIDDLRTTIATRAGDILWNTFCEDMQQQVQPDIILVDSRTGINEWGAFSLLRAADKAVVFLYPNTQNADGIHLLLNALAGKISLQLVFSPVPFGEVGQQRVQEHWNILQQAHRETLSDPSAALSDDAQEYADILSSLDDVVLSEEENNEDEDADTQVVLADPIVIQYVTELALAASFPVLPLLSYYMPLANVIDAETTAKNLEDVLVQTAQRWEIVESLEFPEVNAADIQQNLRDLFQRTSDFDKFLDDATCLIRGRKGTGKTALYLLLLKHTAVTQDLSLGRLRQVQFFSGHGSDQSGRPTKSDFQLVSERIQEVHNRWEAFWRFYLLLRLHQENFLQRYNCDSTLQLLRRTFVNIPHGENMSDWQSAHTMLLAQLCARSDQDLLAKDCLLALNKLLRAEHKTLWFLYDDLDVDLDSSIREAALKGLFSFMQASDAQRLTNIRFKIFLREDIWSRLVFDNKSHFNGRDIILQWTRTDFLRLALRQALQSQQFADLVNRFAPVRNIDQASEETIQKALQLLWGNRKDKNSKSKYVARWIYDRLTDSSKTTFPRSLNILLKKAREYELAHREEVLPNDRLLRSRSLNEGLIDASNQRCHELKEEYPELVSFFDALKNMSIVASRDDLHRIWQRTVQRTLPEFKKFDDFLSFLLSIGLINVAELRGKEQGYRFAEIYTHGFHIYRGTRKI